MIVQNPSLNLVLRKIRNELLEDQVGLWNLLSRVKAITPDSNQWMQLTLEIVMHLLSTNEVLAGQFRLVSDVPKKGYCFELWNLSCGEAVERIRCEWERLGREPTMGEIVYFIDRSTLRYANFPIVGFNWDDLGQVP